MIFHSHVKLLEGTTGGPVMSKHVKSLKEELTTSHAFSSALVAGLGLSEMAHNQGIVVTTHLGGGHLQASESLPPI